MATTRRRRAFDRKGTPNVPPVTRSGQPDRRYTRFLSQSQANDNVPVAAPGTPPSTDADQLVKEAQAAMQPSVVPLGEPRRRPGRPPREVGDMQKQAEIDGLSNLLAPAFRAMGDTLFHGMLQIPEPQWGDSQSVALAKAWAPVMQQYVQSPVVAAVVTTLGVTLPYLFVIAQRQVNAREQKRRERAIAAAPAAQQE